MDRAGLDWAFRFASAITPDPVDQAQSQEKVLRDYLALGDLGAVTARVERIPNWRRGVVYADLANAYYQRGETNAAVQAIRAAELVQQAYRGDWPSQRIAAHLARAHLRAGNSALAQSIGEKLPAEEAAKVDAVQFHGTNALAALDQLAAGQNFDALCAAADGYLVVAGTGSTAVRARALAGAERVLSILPVIKRLELIPTVAERYLDAGLTNETRRVLAAHESWLAGHPAEPLYLAPALARMGWVGHRLGEEATARRWFDEAQAVAQSGNPLDQPTACAGVLDLLAQAGDTPGAWNLYERSLTVAAGFVNARPRAMAVADLCRALGRAVLPVEGKRAERLAELLTGLQDPW